jgi:hypothetical protein
VRAAAHALHDCGLEPGEPLRVRLDRRLPALSLLRGQMQAHEIRWASLVKRRMSVPISEMIIRALRLLTHPPLEEALDSDA